LWEHLKQTNVGDRKETITSLPLQPTPPIKAIHTEEKQLTFTNDRPSDRPSSEIYSPPQLPPVQPLAHVPVVEPSSVNQTTKSTQTIASTDIQPAPTNAQPAPINDQPDSFET
jgi:hypothetical protein